MKAFSIPRMQLGNMLRSVLFFSLLFKGLPLEIAFYGNTSAEYGGEVYYRCQVDSQTGVRQVTWQRLSGDESVENLATYSKRFGQQVNAPFVGKLLFTEATLGSPSITLTNVSWQDEGCYICSFNVFPDGSQRKQTCLAVHGISEVHTSLVFRGERVEGAEREVGFTCSATGKPAPTVEWDTPAGATGLDRPPAVTVQNEDRTFTTSSNVTLRVPADLVGHVDCLLNGGRRRERIPFAAMSPKKKDEKGSPVAPVVVTVALITCVAIAALLIKRKMSTLKRSDDLVV